jgi:putative ABC transport system permease protein
MDTPVRGVGANARHILAVGRAVRSLLFGLEASDPLTLVAAGTALAVVALLASYLPARRASMVDPAIALWGE